MILCLPAAHASIFNTPHQEFLNQCVKLFLCHSSGLPKWGRLVEGDNLGKMVKNCMKITKSLFRGKQWGGAWGAWGVKPVPPSQQWETLFVNFYQQTFLATFYLILFHLCYLIVWCESH